MPRLRIIRQSEQFRRERCKRDDETISDGSHKWTSSSLQHANVDHFMFGAAMSLIRPLWQMFHLDLPLLSPSFSFQPPHC